MFWIPACAGMTTLPVTQGLQNSYPLAFILCPLAFVLFPLAFIHELRAMSYLLLMFWIPACAGMTTLPVAQGLQNSYPLAFILCPLSFVLYPLAFIHELRAMSYLLLMFWIPACAGMTTLPVAQGLQNSYPLAFSLCPLASGL
jgi:hypothetical protein